MDPLRYHQSRIANIAQTLALFAAMACMLGLLGWMLFGPGALAWVAAAAGLGLAISPSLDPRAVLRLHRAQPLQQHQAPELHALLDDLSRRLELDHPPQLFLIPSLGNNAFAVGRSNRAAIALTLGLLRTLNPRELAGVLAHELSHVRNNDMRVMTLADAATRLTRSLAFVGQILLVLQIPMVLIGKAAFPLPALLILVLAPGLMGLLQLGLSRTREYRADLEAARITGDPLGLAHALHKIDRHERNLLQRLFLPYRAAESNWTRSHPHTADRIRALTDLRPQEPLTTGFTSHPSFR